MIEAALNLRVGVWLDDLRAGVKQGLKLSALWRADVAGLDAFGEEVSPRTFSGSGRRDLARHIRSQGVELAALRADVGGRRLADPRSLDANLGRLQEAMQLAADLKAPRIVVPAGFVPPEQEKGENSARATLTEAARALCETAARTGVRLCWQAGSEPPDVLAAFLNGVDPGGILAVDLNPGAFVMRDVDPLKALLALSARVSIASAADHYRGGAEAPFGQGDVRWDEVLVGLSTLQHSLPMDILAACALESDRVKMLAAACVRLKALQKNPLG